MGSVILLCVSLCIWSKIRHRRRRIKEILERENAPPRRVPIPYWTSYPYSEDESFDSRDQTDES